MTLSPLPSTELTQIGHYQIANIIGRGGMGLVYLARDQKLGRQVAIKCLRNDLVEQNYRDRFKREALLLAKLNHANIVQIYDFIDNDEQLALVMEYVDGQNLQKTLREQVVPMAKRLQWLIQIAEGLAIAHDAGIIHRDLKAENILINQRGVAKISDLGIAKSQEFNATVTDYVTGSYASMSPEQAMGEELNFKSDLFSFGILAYQLLCGSHPFGDTPNKLQLMQRIISHPPIPPTKFNPNLPIEMCQLLGMLLSKNIDKRPESAHWVAEQLTQISEHMTTPVFEGDETQALTTGKNAHRESGKEKSLAAMQIAEDTFSTSLSAPRTINPLFTLGPRQLITEYPTAIAIALITIMTSVALLWHIYTKQPRYVAIMPPAISAEGMQTSQQELIKSTVLDAIQQSALQLDGYYLIPQNEVADISGDADNIRIATGADEIISTNIQCNIESCTLNLVRLSPDSNNTNGRLRVQNTKTVDVLTDNYLSLADIVQTNIGQLYSTKLMSALAGIDEKEYAIFLETNMQYLAKGADEAQLDTLDKLQTKTKSLGAVQTLYKDIALDVHFENQKPELLEKLSKLLQLNTNGNNITYLYNLFYLQIAKKDFNGSSATIEKIKKSTASQSVGNALKAYESIAKQDYQSAIGFYKKALEAKTTYSNLYNIANAFWYIGNTVEAKSYLNKALALSTQKKAYGFYGLISLTEGNTQEAIEFFNKVIEKSPNDFTTLDHLGLCYLLEKKYSYAFAMFEKASQLDPNNETVLLNKADTKDLSGDAITSHEIYNNIIAALKNESPSANHLRSLAQAYAHTGEFSNALTTLQALEKIDPDNVSSIYTSALVHTLANNKSSAILSVKNALENGMNKIWFSFAWFDTLCTNNDFVGLLKNHGEPNRCTLQPQ